MTFAYAEQQIFNLPFTTLLFPGRLSLSLPTTQACDLCEAGSPRATCNVMAIG